MTREQLHEAALASLARRATTAVGLKRALQQRVRRWTMKQKDEPSEADLAQCSEHIDAIISRFREVGLINDTAFAASRAASLSRAGRSRRAIVAKLSEKGVAANIIRETVPNDADQELASAITFARKRRIGPYAKSESTDPKVRQRALAAMARAGFAWNICSRVFNMTREQADEQSSEMA